MIDKPLDGVTVDQRTHPAGRKGALLSLNEVAERAWKARMSPRLRAWVTQQLDKCSVSRGTRRQKMQCVLDAVRAKVPYISDPVMGEFMATPDQVLCLDHDRGLCIIGADCFPEGTLLLRDDFVFVPVEEIKVGERIWGKDRWSTVTEKWAKGQLAVDAIEMSNGSTMYLTGDHKVYVGQCKHGGRCEQVQCEPSFKRMESFDRLRVSDLREGDTLLQPERISFGSGHVDADRMYVEALALADGWTKASKNPELPHVCFYVAGRDGKRKEEQKHEVKAICERLGIETLWHSRYITVKDREWATRIAELGSRARFKHLETINLDESGAAAALRGLMADSTKNTGSSSTRTFSTTSRQIMLQVRVLHRMFGKMTSVKMMTPEQHGGAGRHPMWRVGQREKHGMHLSVESIERAVRKVPCWDIATDDHYVYLPEHDVTVSNCDEFTIILVGGSLSIGIPAMVIGSSHKHPHEVPTHVFGAFQDEQEDWIRMDGTTKHPIGKVSPHQREWWVEPGAEAKNRGEGDFVGMAGGSEVGVSGVGLASTVDLRYPYIR